MSIVHAHLLLNHIPVVGAIIGALLFAYALMRRNSELGKLALGFYAVLAVIAVAVFLTGEPAEEAVERLPGFSDAITERHEELARISTVTLVAFGALALGLLAAFRRRLLPRWAAITGFAFALGVAGLMAATANLGGQIRHSEIRPAMSAFESGAPSDAGGEVESRR